MSSGLFYVAFLTREVCWINVGNQIYIHSKKVFVQSGCTRERKGKMHGAPEAVAGRKVNNLSKSAIKGLYVKFIQFNGIMDKDIQGVDSVLSLFSLCVSVCTHNRQVENQHCSRTGTVHKYHNILRKKQSKQVNVESFY